MLLLTCCSIQSFAFWENPGEVALKCYTASCANYFENALSGALTVRAIARDFPRPNLGPVSPFPIEKYVNFPSFRPKNPKKWVRIPIL